MFLPILEQTVESEDAGWYEVVRFEKVEVLESFSHDLHMSIWMPKYLMVYAQLDVLPSLLLLLDKSGR